MPQAKSGGTSVTSALLSLVGLSALAGLLAAMVVAPAVAVTGVVANSGIALFDSLPDKLQAVTLSQPSSMYARNGKDEDGNTKWVKFAQFYDKNRRVITYDEISPYMIAATVAAEDERFYSHNGVDLKGLMRAFVVNATSGRTEEGASTIPMQLVRNWLREIAEDSQDPELLKAYNEVTIERKLQEIKYAISLEKTMSKEDIITQYLNIAIFGGQVYGIEAAAQRYFSKSAIDLTPAESASLIAIVQYPSLYRLDLPDSADNGEANGYAATRNRRDAILNIMYGRLGLITEAEFNEAIATPVQPKISPVPNGCQYASIDDGKTQFANTFCDYVKAEVRKLPGLHSDPNMRMTVLMRGGFQIYTTLDVRLQKTAQSLTKKYVPAGRWAGLDAGSVVTSVEVGTGRILAMAQNKPYDSTEAAAKSKKKTAINYAADVDYGGSSGFQTGSTFKSFTLATWLANGRAVSDHVDGSQRPFKMNEFTDSCLGVGGPDWKPANAGGGGGSMSVLQATMSSVNTAFIDMATELDLCEIRKTAEALGAHRADKNPLHAGPSMVIGSDEVAPLSMAVAYAAIANEGQSCTPIAIERIEALDGKEVPVEPSVCNRVLSPDVANATVYTLKRVITGGTGVGSNPGDGVPVFGKTGTTDGTTQTWMMASTKKVATAVWVGNVTGKKTLYNYVSNGMGLNNVRHAIMKAMLKKINGIKEYRGGDWKSPPGALIQGQSIQVPATLVGMQSGEAEELLESLGFNVKVSNSYITSDLPRGLVAQVIPGAGTNQPRGRLIVLKLSNGQGISIPTVAGMNAADAESALRAAGFTGTITVVTQHHATVPEHQVIGTNPAAGKFAKANATIKIVVSAGTEDVPPPPGP